MRKHCRGENCYDLKKSYPCRCECIECRVGTVPLPETIDREPDGHPSHQMARRKKEADLKAESQREWLEAEQWYATMEGCDWLGNRED